jgi:hypothetical protein
VERGFISPDSHTNPTQLCPLGSAERNTQQLQVSPSGFISAVSLMPAIKPRLLFTGHTTELLGPPRVPKSVGEPCRQRVACRVWSTGSVENPAIQPRLLMLLPLADPPKDSRFVTSYVVCRCAGSAGAAGVTAATTSTRGTASTPR